jgi:hypothetical protein
LIDDDTAESDVYIIPMESQRLVDTSGYATFWEYYDMRNPMLERLQQRMAPFGFLEPLSNGRYLLVNKAPSNVCFQFQMIERPRLVVYTPFLAARITDWRYNFTIHERSYDPASPFFYDGGSTAQNPNIPYFYPPLGA